MTTGCEISAHSGGGETHRAATLEAYADAAATGAEWAEFDVRRLDDGTLVVLHDPPPAGLTYAELCVTYGYEVPRVDDVLGLLARGGLGAHVDLKEVGYEHEVVDLTERFVGGHYVVTSLEDASVLAVATRYPHARVALSLGRDLTGAAPEVAAAVRHSELYPEERLAACRARGVAMHHELARRRLLALTADRGLEAWVWTVDDDADLRELLPDPRVTVLITNRPRRAVELRVIVAR